MLRGRTRTSNLPSAWLKRARVPDGWKALTPLRCLAAEHIAKPASLERIEKVLAVADASGDRE